MNKTRDTNFNLLGVSFKTSANDANLHRNDKNVLYM